MGLKNALGIYLIICSLCMACTFTQKIQSGEEAFRLRQYTVAIDMLSEDYNRADNKGVKAEKAYYIGTCFSRMGKYRDAIRWYSIADEFGHGIEATKQLGLAQKMDENYRGAIQTFRRYEMKGGPILDVSKEISYCENALMWKGDRQSYDINAVPIEGDGSIYAPTFFENNFIVYTSDQSNSTGEELYNWTGRKYSDLYIINKTGGEPMLFDQNLNTEHNEGAACFNSDFSEIFFTRCHTDQGDDYCKILRSVKQGKTWSDPVPAFFMNKKNNYRQPTLIENDSVLIYSSDAKGAGDYDLYYSVLEEDEWSFPELMPEQINTEGNEMFPTADGDTLYFSSDHLPGMGGLDIFKTYLQNGNKWARPENIKYPLNSGADDFSMIIERKLVGGRIQKNGYLSSSRSGDGTDQIYKYEILDKVIEKEKEDEEPIVDAPKVDRKVYLAIRVVEELYQKEDDPNSPVVGKKPLRRTTIKIDDGLEIRELKTNLSGRLIIDGNWSTAYSFLASKTGYLNNTAVKDIPMQSESLEEDMTYNVEIVLDKIYANKEIVLENIYYDFDKWDIKDEAKPSLDSLIQILKNNPQINIELSSHTDCVGDNEYNKELSQKRANSAVAYIIQNEVNQSRLQALGYGEERLAINCDCTQCTDEEHQINRRTTFKIIEQ